ncbi:hypothetical protein DU504_13945 [Haloplanus salinus]|jgi:hypothetical protein|uniref:Uncharacterized protein n=1 Tax=Haloplanus salinus TaxID=1126245 RepID=A0A368NDY6_9EURY|nr:hypothetical protein [Haloplanus salinus]RCU48708.1 hypothetical protein DU504_13945 [Haloplanus salinus]
MPSYRTLARRLSAFGALAGLAHLLVPARLLAAAEWGYDRALAVEFAPRPAAPRRVRLIGLVMLVGAALCYRLLGRSR